MILTVIFVVLMMFWLFNGCYTNWDANRPIVLGNTLIPWLCVAILAFAVFSAGPVLVPVR